MTREIPVSTPAPRPKRIIERPALTPPARILVQWLALLALILSGCDGGEEPSGTFAARAATSEVYVGVVTDGDKVVAYVCDGQTLAQWFVGSADPADIRLASNGAQFTASIGAAGGRGELALDDGLILPFELSRVDGEAGLYRVEETIAGAEIRGGWIVLPDGSQRGAVLSGTSIVSTQPLDLTTFAVTVSGIGTLQAVKLRPPNAGLGGFQFGR